MQLNIERHKLWCSEGNAAQHRATLNYNRQDSSTVQYGAIPKRPIAKTAPKILMPKNCSKWLIALSKTAHHTTKTAHSKVQNGPQLHPKRPIVIIGIRQHPK